jgi:hypothetical protein
MARCEQGYLCEVCGREVEDITDSDLYLRYVLGEVDPETLHISRERHIRCNPTLAQFIVAEGFEPIVASGLFAKLHLDSEFVRAEERRVTRGYLRLAEVIRLGLPITDYPLPEVRDRWQAAGGACESARSDDGPGATRLACSPGDDRLGSR